jgi:REP element-mobilizing transposase RayT
MSLHSYSRCWLHLIWTTLDREPMLVKPAAAKASRFLTNVCVREGHLHED